MLGKLALLLKGKLAAAILGTALLVGGGTTAVLAANSAQLQLPLVSQTQSQEHANNHDANDDHGGNNQGANQNDDNNQGQDDDQNENELRGTVGSIDTGNASFVLKPSGGTTKTVVVSAKTVFDGGLSKLADLKVGQFLEVKGNAQSNGTLAATRVHREDNDANDDNDGANQAGDGHGDNSGSGGSGRGGHDDDGADN